MIIGFIGFGKVSENLVRIIQSESIDFVTSTENRSPETIELIKKSDVTILESFPEVVSSSDILISANSPANALDVAKKYGEHAKGIYLDLNNVSPDTTSEISSYVNNFVDGAIIGKIDSDNPILYLSGKPADELLFFNEFMQVKVISDRIGDASLLKMLRSTYTKTLSALLIESRDLACKYDLEEEFIDMLTLTEGDDFRQKSLSRINNTLNSKKRKSEELKEIIDYFDDDLIMVKAALEKLNR